MALTALMLPLAHARHLHDQLALGFEYDDANSGSASSSGSSSSSSDSQFVWHANPFYGLSQSFGDAGYDSDTSSSKSEMSFEEITQAAVRAAMRELQRQQIRHRRSHDLKYFLPTASKTPEWENPCFGGYDPKKPEIILSQQQKLAALRKLRLNTCQEYTYIKDNLNFETDTSQPFAGAYSFLPNMTEPTRKRKLKTWHRNMQLFIGSFAYLGKTHYKYRYENQLPLDNTTTELHELLLSARRVLCEIETVFNATHPKSNGSKLKVLSKGAMHDKLDELFTKSDSKEVALGDLKFTKQLYYKFLVHLSDSLKISNKYLDKKIKKERSRQQSTGSNSGMESSESSGSAEQQNVPARTVPNIKRRGR
ncbi:GH17793 [Drosophila grimshawi]|uniref:GH17793 n=1 Tax=Drosophila grimshawi TaxID=7222 RepID=B4JXR8_DROGR|nr:GH17793 [Drosophila grimshawi]